MGAAGERDEGLDERLAAYLEGELEGDDRDQVERHLESHPEDRYELGFHRALGRRLARVPGESAPVDFAAKVMEAAPGTPGSLSHRIELVLRRFLQPALVLAGGLAAWVVLGPLLPGHAPEVAGGFGPGAPRTSLALLETGSGGAVLTSGSIPAHERKALGAGQVVQLGFGTPGLVRFPGGVGALVHPGTRFSIRERALYLTQGKVRVKVTPGIGDFAVHGPEASAHVVGTEFEVEALDGTTRVGVQEGVVEVRREGRPPVRLKAGESVAASDSESDWIRPQARLPEIPPPTTVPSDSAEGVPTLDTP